MMPDPSILSDPFDSSDWDAQPALSITLSSIQIRRAADWSQPIPDPDRQWRTYLNGLALLGFQQWLHQRAPELVLHDETCWMRSPLYTYLINAATPIQVNGFQLCLVAIDSLSDTQVSLPRAVLDMPEFTAHFYVLVEVVEEDDQTQVYGFMRHEHLRQQLDSLDIELDWNYAIPVQWFTPVPDELLLTLRALNPQSIALPDMVPVSPGATPDTTGTIASVKKKLEMALPQLRSQKRTLWQILTWDEGKILLRNPDLMTWLSEQMLQTASQFQTALLQSSRQAIVNTAFWLNDQLDTAAQTLSLMLMPGAVPAWRSLRGLDRIRADLAVLGIEIPPEARGTYQDWQWQHLSLRLYAIVWTLSTPDSGEEIHPDHESHPENIPEWALLLVLGAQPDARPPFGVKLTVNNSTQGLVEEMLEERSNNSYLYAQVVDNWNEQFEVTISLDDEIIHKLIYQFEQEAV